MIPYDLKRATFLIPVKFDSLERVRNLKIVLRFLSTYVETSILVMEIGRQCYFRQQIEDLLDRVEYVFAKDDEDFFHRT